MGFLETEAYFKFLVDSACLIFVAACTADVNEAQSITHHRTSAMHRKFRKASEKKPASTAEDGSLFTAKVCGISDREFKW